jgi:acyl-CoA synthetase (AMP-forming)/AMP-acid ligase II
LNLADLIASHARNRPGDQAIVYGTQVLSYREFHARLEAFAARLHDAGINPGDVLGLCLPDEADHLVLHFAAARLGAVILPMDHRWSATEKADVAGAFGAARVILPASAAPIPELHCLALQADWAGMATERLPPTPRDSSQPLLVSLSSGTTGRPKGALVTHGQMYERFINQWVTLSLNVSDRFISVTPVYFGAARSFCMSILAAGATLILDPPPHKPGQLAAAINGSAATVCFLVPTLMRRLLAEAPSAGGPLLPGLRLLVFGGSMVPGEEAEVFRDRLTPNLASYYATSEGGGISVLRPEEFRRHGDTVGRGTFRVEVQVVNEHDEPQPAGATGRLRFRGPGVATRFLDDAGREMDSAGWFYPGDLAAIDADGYITLRGREKDMIIRGGVNVYPAEIERVLCAHPDVREAAVTGWPSTLLGEDIAAFVVTARPVGVETLLAHCKARLAPYKVPRAIYPLAELPKTNFGKVRKADLLSLLPPRDQ